RMTPIQALFSRARNSLLDLTFYEHFFAQVHAIEEGHNASILKLRQMQGLLFFGSLYMVLLALLQSRLSLLANVLLYNLAYCLGLESWWNTIIAAVLTFASYLYSLLYENNSGESARILEKLLLEGECPLLALSNEASTRYRSRK